MQSGPSTFPTNAIRSARLQDHPHTVTQALNRLEKDLTNNLPNAGLVKLTINMIEKEERLISLKDQMARLQNEINGMHNNYLGAVQTGKSGSMPQKMMSPQSEAYSLVVSSLTRGGDRRAEAFEGNPSSSHNNGSGGFGSGLGASTSQLSCAADTTSPMKYPSICMALTSDDDVTKKGDLFGAYENSFSLEDSHLAEFELEHLVDKSRSKSTRKLVVSQLKPICACEEAQPREEVSHQPKEIKPTCSKSSTSLKSPTCFSSSTSQTSSMSHSLPWKIAQALVTMASMMMTSYQSDLKTLLRGPQGVDVWEMFCAPDSWLTSVFQESGLKCSRINLHMGFDLYEPKTHDRLRSKFANEKPRKVWVSTRCTYTGVPGLL